MAESTEVRERERAVLLLRESTTLWGPGRRDRDPLGTPSGQTRVTATLFHVSSVTFQVHDLKEQVGLTGGTADFGVGTQNLSAGRPGTPCPARDTRCHLTRVGYCPCGSIPCDSISEFLKREPEVPRLMRPGFRGRSRVLYSSSTARMYQNLPPVQLGKCCNTSHVLFALRFNGIT